MKLVKPLIIFDLETTGVDTSKDRIVQIAAIKMFPDGSTEEKNLLINPEMPIPAEAMEVHGVTDDMVKDSPKFKQISKALKSWFEGCDIGGFNSDNYDVQLLSIEMERAGILFIDWDCNFVDVSKIYRHLYPRTLSAVYERLTGQSHDNAHDAMADVRATKKILEVLCQNNMPEDITSAEIDDLLQGDKKRVDLAGKMYKDANGDIRWNFSKNMNQLVTSDYGFAEWVLKNDFPLETKKIIRELIKS